MLTNSVGYYFFFKADKQTFKTQIVIR